MCECDISGMLTLAVLVGDVWRSGLLV